MRKLHIALAALAFSSAAGAFAETPYPVDKPFVPTLTRAQVRQDLIKAEHQGLLSEGNSYPVVMQASSQMSRQDVERQVTTAQNSHADTIYNGA